jgi:hypothetical protein
VFAYYVERFTWKGLRWPRVVLAATVAIGLCTILVVPLEGSYSFGAGAWTSPRLARLRFHPPQVPYFSASRSTSRYDLLDASLDAAATRIASLTTPGETVLVLSENDLLTFASETQPVGGRYAPAFYLLRAGMLDRQGFLSLLPNETYRKLLDDPPRILVSEPGNDILLDRLPELRTALRNKGYELDSRHGYLRIYRRSGGAKGAIHE